MRMRGVWEALQIVDAESKQLIWDAYFAREEMFDVSQMQLN
jgi:hypothetical protein